MKQSAPEIELETVDIRCENCGRTFADGRVVIARSASEPPFVWLLCPACADQVERRPHLRLVAAPTSPDRPGPIRAEVG